MRRISSIADGSQFASAATGVTVRLPRIRMQKGSGGAALGVLGLLTLVQAGCGAWGDRVACGEDDCGWSGDTWARVKDLANITATPPPRDLSNEYLPTDDVWLAAHAFDADPALDDQSFVFPPIVQLGWELYYDPRLSGPARFVDSLDRDTTTNRSSGRGCSMDVSCATCHDPSRAGSDVTSIPRHVSTGAGRYDVNSEQTLNVARYPLLYWNGRTDSVWAQAAQVIESPISMNGDRLNTARVIVDHYAAEYAAVFADPLPSAADLAAATACYKGIVDPALKGVVTRVHVNVAKAIAAYEWLLSSDRSPFDRFVAEGPGSTLLSPAEQRGLKVFVGRGSCYDCHRTPLLSDGQFHNVGVPQVGESIPTLAECVLPAAGLQATPGCAGAPSCDCTVAAKCLPWGAFTGRAKLMTEELARSSVWSGDPTSVLDLAAAPALKGAWRTPSLRDVALTGPYMHDGLFDTLADVVWHYDQGGTAPVDPYGGGCDPGSDASCTEIRPLGLSAQDRSDLVAFLGSLTGQARPARLIMRPPNGLPGLPTDPPAACPTTESSATAASIAGEQP